MYVCKYVSVYVYMQCRHLSVVGVYCVYYMCVPVTLKHKDVYVINGTVQWFQAILRNRGAVLHLFMTLSGTGETTPRVSVQTYMHQLQDLLFLLIHYLTLDSWFHCARFSPMG